MDKTANNEPHSVVPDDPSLEDGAYRVANADDLVMLTDQGWRLARVLTETVAVGSHTENQVVAEYPGGPASPRSVTVPDYGQGHRYLLRRRLEDVTAELRAALSGACADVERLTTAARAAEAERDKLRRELAAHVGHVERLRAEAASEATRREASVESYRRLEGDLAKLRRAIGEIEYQKIVGATAGT